MIAGQSPLVCARCAVELQPGQGNFYVVAIMAVADPDPPIFTEEDLTRDVGKEIRLLLSRLRGLGEQDALDQVYQRKLLHLCTPCYNVWIQNPARG